MSEAMESEYGPWPVLKASGTVSPNTDLAAGETRRSIMTLLLAY